ncbi:hypothetical protein [Halovivax cerinus]|uniref:DUF3267 domain-containing protein n=1 Tax=Halovivax cerinus TaxID=1487865 RepID=A0ABD5NP34_9EURY|nr:hypothetical protein [Halovivax cerinus]
MVPELTLVTASLALGVSAGLLAHEGTHAAVLHLSGIPYTVSIFPRRDGHPIRWLARTPWAVVHPDPGPDSPTWALQLGALAPLTLSIAPFALATVGHAPSLAHPIPTAFVLGWLACAIPSPQDFSVAFHARRALDAAGPVDDPSPERDGVVASSEPVSD